MTLMELKQRMTAEELTGWYAYYCIKDENERKAMEAAKRRR